MVSKQAMEIYMMKKSARGFIVSFRLGTDHNVRPGMHLNVLNEDGMPVGSVEVISSTETESEALVSQQGGISLGCRVHPPEKPGLRP